jgi:hypothetical protein
MAAIRDSELEQCLVDAVLWVPGPTSHTEKFNALLSSYLAILILIRIVRQTATVGDGATSDKRGLFVPVRIHPRM